MKALANSQITLLNFYDFIKFPTPPNPASPAWLRRLYLSCFSATQYFLTISGCSNDGLRNIGIGAGA
jgi:hypothetical protein